MNLKLDAQPAPKRSIKWHTIWMVAIFLDMIPGESLECLDSSTSGLSRKLIGDFRCTKLGNKVNILLKKKSHRLRYNIRHKVQQSAATLT